MDVYMLQPSLLLEQVLLVTCHVLCPATAFALKRNTVLTELILQFCGINAEGISHLEQALCVNTTLRVLDLTGNTHSVNSEGAAHLGKLSGRVGGYGLTYNIRQGKCATSNRKMSVVQNLSIKISILDGAMLLF